MLGGISLGLLLLLAAPSVVRAGLYYSGEQYASLPTQWRGFLLDHRTLRNAAQKPKMESEASPLRVAARCPLHLGHLPRHQHRRRAHVRW